MTARQPGACCSSSRTTTSIGRLVKSYLEQQDGWRVVWLRTGEEAVAELRTPSGAARRARHRPARDRRLRGLPADARAVEGADRDADRARRRARPRRRPRARRRRLRRRSRSRRASSRRGSRRSCGASSSATTTRCSRRATSSCGATRTTSPSPASMIELTSKEFDLLACFLEHPGIVLSREKLLDLVWGMTYPGRHAHGRRARRAAAAQARRPGLDPHRARRRVQALTRRDEPPLAAVPGDRA